MARWEDTALTNNIKFPDPIEALIESQMDQDEFEERIRLREQRERESANGWDNVYRDPDRDRNRDNRYRGPLYEPEDFVIPNGTPSNPINVDGEDDFPPLNGERPPNSMANDNFRDLMDRIKFLEEENAQLVIDKQQLEERLNELEKAEESAIPGMSNHVRSSRNQDTLSAMVHIDNREVLVDNLSPRMTGWEFGQRVSEVAGGHHRNLIVLQHTMIHPDLPLHQLGLGTRPFYAISLGERRLERGRTLKVKLMGRGPII